MIRFAARALLLAVAVTGLAAGHTVFRGESEMDLSDRAFHEGDLVEALTHARRAAVLYVPGAPHIRDAYSRLAAIAVGCESSGQTAMARRGWQAVRSCALETRHLWIPQRDQLERANRRLAVLYQAESASARSRAQDESTVPENATERRVWRVGLLAVGLGLVMLALAWIYGRGLTPEGQVRWVWTRRALLLLGSGVLCWTLALLRA